MLSQIIKGVLNNPGNADLSAILEQALALKQNDPNGPTYQSLRKLYGKCLLWNNMDTEAAYNLMESLAPTLRTIALYRYEQHAVDSMIKMQQCAPHINNLCQQLSTRKKISKSTSLNKFVKKFASLDTGPIGSYKDACPKTALDTNCLNFTNNDTVDVVKMLERLKNLPKEWTIVQLTATYNPSEPWQDRKSLNSSIVAFHLTVLKSAYIDSVNVYPVTVTISQDSVKGDDKPLFSELHSLLEENVLIIGNSENHTSERSIRNYWEKRSDADNRIKDIINSMENCWLCGWKCLLVGRIQDNSLKETIEKLVNEVCAENKITKLSKKQLCLLYVLMSSTHYLTGTDVCSMIRQIFTEFLDIDTRRDAKNLKSVIDLTECSLCAAEHGSANFRLCLECRECYFERYVTSAKGLQLHECVNVFASLAKRIKNDPKMAPLKKTPRDPVILIVDEYLDTFPWESLPILVNQPVTRMENFHFLYALYDRHKDNIIDGHFLLKPVDCRYLINPSNDLLRMEKRMSTFINYWCPEWTGETNKPPPSETCLDYIAKSNIFLYCGHGDGCQYVSNNLADIEGAEKITSSALLYGCSSVRLVAPGGRHPAIAAHQYYHIAGCPSVVGMLWEVTDLEVDKIATMLLSLFVPSKVKPHWGNVGKISWTQGKLNTNVEDKLKYDPIPDLLKAISMSRKFTKFMMISSSIVARGLPVKIHPHHQIS